MIRARQGYTRSETPEKYRPDWYSTQLGYVERAIPTGGRVLQVDGTLTGKDDLGVIYCDPDANGGTLDFTLLPPDQCQFIQFTVVQISAGVVTLVGVVSGATNPTVSGLNGSITVSCSGSAFFKNAEI